MGFCAAMKQGDRGVGRAAAENRPELRGRSGRARRQPNVAEADEGEELAERDAALPVARGGGGGGGGGRGQRRRGWRRPEANAAGYGAH